MIMLHFQDQGTLILQIVGLVNSNIILEKHSIHLKNETKVEVNYFGYHKKALIKEVQNASEKNKETKV